MQVHMHLWQQWWQLLKNQPFHEEEGGREGGEEEEEDVGLSGKRVEYVEQEKEEQSLEAI